MSIVPSIPNLTILLRVDELYDVKSPKTIKSWLGIGVGVGVGVVVVVGVTVSVGVGVMCRRNSRL